MDPAERLRRFTADVPAPSPADPDPIYRRGRRRRHVRRAISAGGLALVSIAAVAGILTALPDGTEPVRPPVIAVPDGPERDDQAPDEPPAPPPADPDEPTTPPPDTPESGGDATPESGGDATPESGGDATPESGGDTAVTLDATVLADEVTARDDGQFDTVADLATTPAELVRLWSDFGLSGEPPEVDFDEAHVLTLGVSGSGECPPAFHDARVNDGTVEVRLGFRAGDTYVRPGEPWPEGTICTDDLSPRTLVIAVSDTNLPTGEFNLLVQQARSSEEVRLEMTG